MAKQALGLLETRGLACIVVGVDAMLKSANVELVGPMKQIGNALCNAVVAGDVAAVKSAIDSGAAAAASAGGDVISARWPKPMGHIRSMMRAVVSLAPPVRSILRSGSTTVRPSHAPASR